MTLITILGGSCCQVADLVRWLKLAVKADSPSGLVRQAGMVLFQACPSVK